MHIDILEYFDLSEAKKKHYLLSTENTFFINMQEFKTEEKWNKEGVEGELI